MPSISSIKDRLFKILEPEVALKFKSPSHELSFEIGKTKNASTSNTMDSTVSIEMSRVGSSSASDTKMNDDGFDGNEIFGDTSTDEVTFSN